MIAEHANTALSEGGGEGQLLYVREVSELIRFGKDVRVAIPDSVRDAIAQRLESLSQACRRVIQPAAVLGRQFQLAPLAALVGARLETLLPLLDEA